MTTLFIPDRGATFSECRRYRYSLWREWGDGDRVAFVGLNPSTADEHVDDNTVRRCVRFAQRWKFGGMWMLNAYAFRSTNPRGLLEVAHPVGDDNDDSILQTVRNPACAKVVCCWGTHCSPDRQASVVRLLKGVELCCFGTNLDGTPKHPLYLPRTAVLERFP